MNMNRQNTIRSIQQPSDASPIETEPHRPNKYVRSRVNSFLQSNSRKRTNQTELITEKQKKIVIEKGRSQSSIADHNKMNKSSVNKFQRSDQNINQKAYKQRIIEQRKASVNQNKQRSYSIDAYFTNKKNMLGSTQMYKSAQLNKKEKITSQDLQKSGFEDELIPFVIECISREEEFVDLCRKGKKDEAEEILISLLNYSIDINNRNLFLNLIKTLGNFHVFMENYETAMKFFVQLREGALLQKMYYELVHGLIGMAQCCDQVNLFKEGIVFLKKALDYAWLGNHTELQLKIYDEIGKKHYRLADMSSANKYHSRYTNASLEPMKSPLRQLAVQTIVENQNQNLNHEYHSLTPLFLVHLNLPLRNRKDLPSLQAEILTSPRDKLPDSLPKKKHIHSRIDEIDFQVKKAMKSWLFFYQSDDPSFIEEKEPEEPEKEKDQKKEQKKNRKQAYLNFKMNQHLRQKGIIYIQNNKETSEMGNQRNKTYEKKQSLDEKVKKVTKEPGLKEGWYDQIVFRVKAEQRRKLSHISDRVRVSGNNSHHSHEKIGALRHLYRSMIEKLHTKEGKMGNKRNMEKETG